MTSCANCTLITIKCLIAERTHRTQRLLLAKEHSSATAREGAPGSSNRLISSISSGCTRNSVSLGFIL